MRVNGDEGTPVPIPNTVVKLINGDNTWLVTAREDNTTRTQIKDDHFDRPFLFAFFVGDIMQNVLISACLMGIPCRYDGQMLDSEFLISEHLQKKYRNRQI